MKLKHLLAALLLETVIALVAAAMMPASAFCQEPHWPMRQVTKPGVVTTGQSITPAGAQSVFSGRVHAVAFGRSEDVIYVALSSGNVYKLNWRTNKVLEIIHGGRNPGMQGLVLDPVGGQPLMSGAIARSISSDRSSSFSHFRSRA